MTATPGNDSPPPDSSRRGSGAPKGGGAAVASASFADLLKAGDRRAAERMLAKMHPHDLARQIEELSEMEQFTAFAIMAPPQAVEVFAHMREEAQHRLLQFLPMVTIRDLLNTVSPDDRARLLASLDKDLGQEMIGLLEPRERSVTESLLKHGEETAGRLMTPSFLRLRPEMTAAEALEHVRRMAPERETVYVCYVIDPGQHLVGVLSLRDLLVAPVDKKVAEIMNSDPKYVRTTTDREEAAKVLSDYDLLAVPVIDELQRLVGIVTWDDVIDVLVQEATEDIHKMAGVGVKEHADSPIMESAMRRVPWLTFNMGWAFAGAAIISVFQGTIEKAAVVAVFMPMISGQAGNAGIQTATITVRSLALGELEWGNVLRMLKKEWTLGFIKGLIFGLILGVVAWQWKGNAYLGAITGSALFLNMLVASTAGVMLPMTLRRLGVDPASIAGVFDTMLTDFMGFLIFLGLATLLVSKLT